MPTQKQRIAIFDMDKTITRKATFVPFVAHVIRRHRPWRALMVPVMVLLGVGYGLKLIDRARLKELNLALLIGRTMPSAELSRIAQTFADETARINMLPGALAEIERLRGAGWRIVLATASYRFYVVEIAGLLAIRDSHDVIATENERKDGIETPWIAGRNCYGPEKLERLERWLTDQGIRREEADIRFYSDHVTDAPCLHFADLAIAANPHRPLRLLAEREGWLIADWR